MASSRVAETSKSEVGTRSVIGPWPRTRACVTLGLVDRVSLVSSELSWATYGVVVVVVVVCYR